MSTKTTNTTIPFPELDYLALCRAHPHARSCDAVPSFYRYRIWLWPNVAFCLLSLASLLAFAGVHIQTSRRAVGRGRGLFFSAAVMLGCAAEAAGYAARLWSWRNQWEEAPFLAQICCLTVGPAFLAAGLYLCLSKIVVVFGEGNSRVRPEFYTQIFIPCDIMALLLQGIGGAISSVSMHNNQPTSTGDTIMLAGLTTQVATLFAFMVCAADFFVQVYRRRRDEPPSSPSSPSSDDQEARRVRRSARFRGHLAAVGLATACVLWRSMFRVVELSDGWSGYLMGRQDLFVGFEGAMVAVATVALNVFHPALCLGDVFGAEAVEEQGQESVEVVSGSSEVSMGGKTLTDVRIEG